ncbi:MAG TPA: beta-ketoacyl synthase N-terminal-like domain-containing protein [Methylomirabilota bacterium]|nr:beta-ketoacyl synthase N-terminal-like domain-containing protein [Methylomirabilota bacterium]
MTPAPSIRALGLLRGTRPNGPVLSLGKPERAEDRFRRATRECLLALAAADAMLEDGGESRDVIAGERTALLYVTAAAYGPSNREFITRSRGGGTHFAYTAPAVVPAEVAIEFGVTGPYTIFLGGAPATLRAIRHAALLLDEEACDRALLVAVEVFDECADLYTRGRRLLGRPLVEAAGCLWLERGTGELVFESSRAAGHGRRRAAGELMSCGPLAELDAWRRRPNGEPLELEGSWRGEAARLTWSAAPARPSAA